jgi:hypothetical protein
LYVHLFAALQIAANTVVGVLWLLGSKKRWAPFAAATAALILPYVPLALWQAPVLLQGARVGYPPTPLAQMIVSLGERLSWHAEPAPSRWLLLPLAVALAVGLWRAWDVDWRAGASLGAWLVVPVALVFALQFTVPVFRDRYLIPLVAPLLVLLALGIAFRPGLHSALIALLVGAGSLYGLLHAPANPDYRAAAGFVRQELRPGQRVGFLAEYAERPFRHYFRQITGAPLEKATLPYTNYPTMSEQDGLRAVANTLRAGETLWIVRWEDWFWDARDLTGQYLRNRGARLTLDRDFSGVRVTRWEVP